MEHRRSVILDIVNEFRPMTVRQVFYQATVRGVIEKTESGYDKVNTDLCVMRRSGELPYEHLVDNTRWVIKPFTFGSPAEALLYAAESYRKDLWQGAKCRVQVWIEKDALTGVVRSVTGERDVPLRAARGYASMTFLHDAAMDIASLDVPCHIYHFGDYDPSGVNAATCIEADLRSMAPHAEIFFERVAVTPDQIRRWRLPTRPTKATDSRAAAFGSSRSVELDAIPPNILRDLVSDVIERHLPPGRLKRLKRQERVEQDRIADLVNEIGET